MHCTCTSSCDGTGSRPQSPPLMASVHLTPFQEEPCCWGWTGWQGGDKHSHLCACSIQNPPLISGRTTRGPSTRFIKEKGGEQGDPLMPLLFSLGQHASLEALQRRMRPTERLMAYLDDIYFASRPERVGDVVAASVQELWAHARIRVHGGKTHIWNRAGTKPGCVTFCRDKLKRRILTQGCGEDPKSPPQNKGSKCWGLLWVTRTLSTNIWNGPGRSTENS